MDLLIIDAGHGGNDPGASKFGYVEKDLTLVIGKRVQELLSIYNPHITRTIDKTIEPNDRTTLIRDKYQYCLSIHLNAGNGNGVEAIHSTFSTKGKRIAELITNELKATGLPLRNTPVFSKTRSDGKDYYYMHRDTGNTVTVIVECLFLDNADNIKLLNVEAIAQSIAKGFKTFIEGIVKVDNPTNRSKYYKNGDSHIIETTPGNIDIKIIGDTLNVVGLNGINGTFFDTPKPELANSCWAIATNEGKAIGGNAMLVSYNKDIKRGTIVYDDDGSIEIVRVNSINEFSKPHRWSISGYSVYPYLNFEEEKMSGGINYKTAHTYIGFKGNKIYLIVKPNHLIKEILPLIKDLGLEGCIVLDGGGSSQLKHPNGNYNSSRKINSAVILKQI